MQQYAWYHMLVVVDGKSECLIRRRTSHKGALRPLFMPRVFNMQALSSAMAVHHEVLRAQLDKFKGVEMQVDGDAVLLGFKDPASAVAWCLATQQVLLGSWLYHK